MLDVIIIIIIIIIIKMGPMESENSTGSYIIHVFSELSLSRNYLTPYAVLRIYNIVSHISTRNYDLVT